MVGFQWAFSDVVVVASAEQGDHSRRLEPVVGLKNATDCVMLTCQPALDEVHLILPSSFNFILFFFCLLVCLFVLIHSTHFPLFLLPGLLESNYFLASKFALLLIPRNRPR
jgi:hypothetical protein